MACVPTVAISKVWPSDGARATSSAPMPPPATALVVDQHLLVHALAQHLRQRSRDNVGGPSRWKGHDQADGLARVAGELALGLSRRWKTEGEQMARRHDGGEESRKS